jgi:adhesin/invasin
MSRRKRRVLALAVFLATFVCLQCAEKEGPVSPYIESEPPQYVMQYLEVSPQRVEPGGQADVETRVVDLDGVPVEALRITFEADYGAITAADVTGADGIARAVYSAPYGRGHVNIMAKGTGIVPKSTFLQVGEGQLSPNPQSILADAISTSLVTLTLVDSNGDPIAGASVNFTTTVGGITGASTVTDEAGYATATLTSAASTTDVSATVQAEIAYGEVSYTEIAYVDMRGITIEVGADPAELPADGSSTSKITVSITETTAGIPVAGVGVIFSSTLGAIDGSGYTDMSGIASVFLMSSTSPGVATVKAAYGLLSGTATVTFGTLQLGLEASEPRAVADGISTQAVTATLLTEDNNPVTGVSIDFTTTDGVITSRATTDIQGQAEVILTSPDYPTEATVSASFGGIVTATAQVTFIDVKLSAEASIERMAADGVSTQTIKAVLLSEDNNPVAGVEIDFSATAGAITGRAVTDIDGEAEATLWSPDLPASATIIASFGGRVADTLEVTFIGLVMWLHTESGRMVADGISYQTITAKLVSDDNNPVCNVPIGFSSTIGTLSGNFTTDCQGRAYATLTSADHPAASVVKVSYRGNYNATTVIFYEDPVITLRPAPMLVSADPSNMASITAYVNFSDASPVPDNTTVRFATNEGTITPSAVTLSGIADVTLRPGGIANDQVTVNAYCGRATASTQMVFAPDMATNVFAYALPESIPADGSAAATIVAQVTDGFGNMVEDGTPVTFSVVSGSGIVTPTAVTVSGIASAKFVPAGGGGGVAAINAYCQGFCHDATVVLLSDMPGAIVADPDTAWISVADTYGESQAVIVAHVLDSYTNPVEDGTEVTFSISYGPGGGEYIDDPAYGYGPVVKQTVGGAAAVALNSGTLPGTVLMTITSGDYAATAVKVGISAGPPDSIFVTTGNIVTGEDGIYVQAVSAIVRDQYNNPVENGTAVYFTLDRPDVGAMNPEAFTGDGFPCLDFVGIPNKGVTHACLNFTTSSMCKDYSIIARCGAIESGFETSIPIVLPVRFAMVASPASVSGSVGGDVFIYVNLWDGYELPISGAGVGFSVTGEGVLSSYTEETDEYGHSMTTLTIPPGTGEGTTTVKAFVWMTDIEVEVEVTITP